MPSARRCVHFADTQRARGARKEGKKTARATRRFVTLNSAPGFLLRCRRRVSRGQRGDRGLRLRGGGRGGGSARGEGGGKCTRALPWMDPPRWRDSRFRGCRAPPKATRWENGRPARRTFTSALVSCPRVGVEREREEGLNLPAVCVRRGRRPIRGLAASPERSVISGSGGATVAFWYVKHFGLLTRVI